MSEAQKAAAAKFCRAHFTKDRWYDADGVSRAISTHPNYAVCRGVLRSAFGDHLVVPAWLELPVMVKGTADAIGLRPTRKHRLAPVDSTQPMGPSNVRWKQPEGSVGCHKVEGLPQGSDHVLGCRCGACLVWLWDTEM